MKRIAMGLGVAALAMAGCDRHDGKPAATAEKEAAVSTEPPLAKAAGDAGLQWGPCPNLPAGCEVAVLHGDPAKPNADVFFKVPAGYAVPPHRHSSAERMVLVAGQLDVRYEGSPGIRLTPGTYAYGPAGRAHAASCVAAEPCILFIAFEGPVDVLPAEG